MVWVKRPGNAFLKLTIVLIFEQNIEHEKFICVN